MLLRAVGGKEGHGQIDRKMLGSAHSSRLVVGFRLLLVGKRSAQSAYPTTHSNNKGVEKVRDA